MKYNTNTTDKLLAGLTFLNRPVFYQTKLSREVKVANIKEVDINISPEGVRKVLCILDNGQHVIMHCHNCPGYIGNYLWGFLTRQELDEYWDM